MNKTTKANTPEPPLPEATVQLEGFQQVRQAHRLELAEDYVELIDDLIREHGQARQVDIAQRLGVAQPTVARTLKRLHAQGLVLLRRYRGVSLTPEGETLADETRERHQLCESMLIALGVEPDVAQRDAEGVEHHVSAETLAAFRRFLNKKTDC